MPRIPSAVLLAGAAVAVSVVALGLYSTPADQVIDAPETVAHRVEAKTDEDGDDEPEYDVVIVGGGTAGCVLASRISENPHIKVLLLEAGGSSRNTQQSRIPAGYSEIFHTAKDYNLWTEPQANALGAKKYWPRAKMLGGCSTINAMMFHAGAPADYNEWAQSGQEGAEAWSHQNFLPYFLKFEKFVPHPRFSDVDPSARGSSGPVQVGFFGHFHPTTAKWMQSCINLGIPHNPDVNTPVGTLGITKVLTYIDPKGQRVTTERAYLTHEVLKRPNLKVAVHAHVTRILFREQAGKKHAVGVEFAQQKGGPRYRVRAKREVVLAAGAVHSPHILMLSGVGSKDHLAKHGIPLVHNLSGVGQNLQDHAVVNVRFRVKAGHSLSFLRAAGGFELFQTLMALSRWKLLGTGPLTTNPAEAAGFVRLDDAKLFPPDTYQIQDETSGPDAPDVEIIFMPLGFTEHGHGPIPSGFLVSMGGVLLRPQSTGTISLKSANPFDAPLIDPKYLDTQNDMASLVRSLKLLLRTAQTEPLASVLVHDDDPALDHNLHHLSDAELEQEVRKRVETLYHPTSTCRMAPLEEGGVVDPYLRVYGIENLRIADASIFPRIPSGHTTAPSIAVGEKAADMIKQSLSKA